MKPAYEHVEFGERCSVRIYHRRLPRIPFEWHHHPEYELTLTMNSQGKRYIGDSVEAYGGDDLVLVPPDLPHTWASNRSIEAGAPQVAIVVWFDGEWARRLGDCCPEYGALHHLLRRSACGLAFDAQAGAAMRARVDELLSSEPRRRLAAVLDTLCLLADTAAVPLASPNAFGARSGRPSGHEPERIDRVLATIEARFAEPLSLSLLSGVANLSERSLTRYFARHIGESVGRYLARVRIGHACRLLIDTALPVSMIAARSGFANVANFNRQFKTMKEMTPAEYRRAFAAGGPREGEPRASSLSERPPSLERKPSRRRARSPARG